MGSSQSKTSDAAIQEKLMERLRALEVKHEANVVNEKDEFVMVNGELPPKYTSTRQDVSLAAAEEWERELLADPKNRLALSALTSNRLQDIVRQRGAKIADTQTFNIQIDLEGAPVTNQRSSGRCWIFASTNVFRVAIMKKYKLKEFELSQSYLFFWDKLEKANYLLESVLETIDEPLDGRMLQALLSSPVGDGGQWDMLANLVNKYGLIPQTLYPDSFNAQYSSAMDTLITTKLREDAIRLRKLASKASTRSAVAATKEKMLQEIHLILTLMLGPPPSANKPFTWEFYDSDGKFNSIKTSPMAFAKELSDTRTVRACGGMDVHRLFSLVNDPRNEYNTHLSVHRLGNVWEGRPINYVNVSMKTMKDAVIATLKKDIPVFFGCDVGKYSDSASGIMDTDLYDYELGFNIRLGMNKAERLQTGESAMTHAMVLTAVHVVDDKPVRWRVQNSWSDSAGTKGFFVMSDAWMDEFVYQAVVDPSVVSEEIRKVLKQEPKMLPLWDPMGALA
ncbi:bleomycin hydrolase [Pseudovirgaria hyperparasitica]|uniref:Cysteine proteinase 1, mitochondrial n=1 Tax=Pseudovirgaria hyperparasitica TaxID=470096 RepID=A0A6A6W7C1_9PEZI|nr:bleomycin hydrolase [Pseudovirgaria hyperparasitica]KAF2758445.1 bleomycin hydrolase [Pseudovirgaria hyperparasitica]